MRVRVRVRVRATSDPGALECGAQGGGPWRAAQAGGVRGGDAARLRALLAKPGEVARQVAVRVVRGRGRGRRRGWSARAAPRRCPARRPARRRPRGRAHMAVMMAALLGQRLRAVRVRVGSE